MGRGGGGLEIVIRGGVSSSGYDGYYRYEGEVEKDGKERKDGIIWISFLFSRHHTHHIYIHYNITGQALRGIY